MPCRVVRSIKADARGLAFGILRLDKPPVGRAIDAPTRRRHHRISMFIDHDGTTFPTLAAPLHTGAAATAA